MDCCSIIVLCHKATHPFQHMVQLKAAADKEKERAKVQKVKDVETQRKALLVKRAPNAYTLFVKDRFPALSHLPREGRFLVRTCGESTKTHPIL